MYIRNIITMTLHKLGSSYGHNQSLESSKNSQPLFYPSKISKSTAFFSNFHVSLKLRIFVILFSIFPLSYLSSSSFFTRCLSLIPQTSNMANAASGMAVHDDCKLKFMELKAKRNYRFIIFKIDNQQVVVEKLGSPGDSYDDFTTSLPADECRYAVYDFDFITHENCQKSKIFFIAWSPDPSKVRSKMVYASSKDRFKRELDGIQFELQATDPSEMSLDIIKGRAF